MLVPRFAEELIMIHLTRLNRSPLVVNSDLIEHIDVTPDTLIVLTTGQKILVLETAGEVVERVIGFRRALLERVSACSHGGCAHRESSHCGCSPPVNTATPGQACLDPVEAGLP
jgi:flagellar protein FlbD